MNVFKFDDLLTKVVNINNFFDIIYNDNNHKVSCTIWNIDFLKFYYDGKNQTIKSEKQLCDFLNDLGYSETKIANALYYFQFGKMPEEKINEPLPNALSFEEQFTQNLLETLQKKGKDCNGGAADSLVLFKKVGSDLNEIFLNTNISPAVKVILTNRAIKTERIKSLLLSGGVPNFESLQDSISDDCCYGVLLAKAVVENANTNANKNDKQGTC